MDDGDSCAIDVHTRATGPRRAENLRVGDIVIVSRFVSGQVGMFQNQETELIRLLSIPRCPWYTNRGFTRNTNDLDHPVVPAPCSEQGTS